MIKSKEEIKLLARAAEHLPPMLHRLAQAHGFRFCRVRISTSKRRWGSCSSRGVINLSFYLMLLPAHLIEYVLLHELCHTVEMNHGPAFWVLLNEHTQQRALALRRELRGYRVPF
jgi:predicted metal-dependent hydrolase